VETRLLIAGEQVEGDGERLAVENPTTEETLADVGTASGEQVDTAIAAAREAFAGWAATPAAERAELLHEVATRLRTRADLATAVRCMRELKAGTVWINDPLTDNDAGPFGGFKQSGLGRELGQEGLEAFQETKHVRMETRIEAKEWWYPYGGGSSG
jgi:acyl-CoA reductase-like NAD-dependent aldehyde dehydrogenase